MYKNKFKLRKVVAIAICLASFSIGNVLAQTAYRKRLGDSNSK